MKTYQPKAKEVKRESHLIDADGQILGRLATKIATLLMGKNKAQYSTQMDMGDSVVVINAKKIVLTGKKTSQKVYRSHSGYPGGFKEKKYREVIERYPEKILTNAVSGMLPDNKLKAERLKRLSIFMEEQNGKKD